MKYLKPSLLCLNLSDTTIWSKSTDNKSIGSLDLWNVFLLSTILLNWFCWQWLSLIIHAKYNSVNYLKAMRPKKKLPPNSPIKHNFV